MSPMWISLNTRPPSKLSVPAKTPLRGVPLDDVDTISKLAPQPFAVVAFQLKHAQAPRTPSKHTSRSTEPRADLQHVIAEVHA